MPINKSFLIQTYKATFKIFVEILQDNNTNLNGIRLEILKIRSILKPADLEMSKWNLKIT